MSDSNLLLLELGKHSLVTNQHYCVIANWNNQESERLKLKSGTMNRLVGDDSGNAKIILTLNNQDNPQQPNLRTIDDISAMALVSHNPPTLYQTLYLVKTSREAIEMKVV